MRATNRNLLRAMAQGANQFKVGMHYHNPYGSSTRMHKAFDYGFQLEHQKSAKEWPLMRIMKTMAQMNRKKVA